MVESAGAGSAAVIAEPVAPDSSEPECEPAGVDGAAPETSAFEIAVLEPDASSSAEKPGEETADPAAESADATAPEQTGEAEWAGGAERVGDAEWAEGAVGSGVPSDRSAIPDISDSSDIRAADGAVPGEAERSVERSGRQDDQNAPQRGDSQLILEEIDLQEGRSAPASAGGEPGAPEVPVAMSDAELRGAVEAILLIVDEPATEVSLAQVLEQPVDRVRGALEDISGQYTSLGLGFDLRRVAGGWRLYTRPEYASYVEKFVLDGQQVRLTQAALETLAVVAYKQPVTRSRISAIRGVNCDGVVRTLVTRGLIEEVGSEPESGAHLYRTTTLFLEKLGLDSVDQLPPLAPFLPDDIDEIADAQR
ncbi:SMC-Scp complex subunit ScpB [Dactylosporangium roseum]|uniref:SMC-Scp complex subunit ScpB n=1 Tax=Dactylosporangium roseum TaxID=47989 RepID=A0ABY5ZEN5_9ACTN|nr:SMC-Scp complex subunit ScpB [Dactylosporangium roseum]